jgi:acetamidase/formamidase
MVAGSARPLSDALRIAFVELVQWLVADHGFEKADAYQLVSQVASMRVANMVDPLYTVVAKFPKRFLPPAPGGGAPADRPRPPLQASSGP